MDHRLGTDLLYLPQIQCVVRPVESVSCAFAPTVKGKFEASHKIFSSKDGMQLIPNNALREIQAASLQHRRIISQIGITAPNIECPTGFQNPGHVSEPRMQTLVEF